MPAKRKPKEPKIDKAPEPQRRRAARVYKRLQERYPDAHCALIHDNPFQLLVATILSAQCTDVLVNKVTPPLFAALPTPQKMADAELATIEQHVSRVNFWRNKAKNLHAMANLLVDEFDSEVPQTMEDLIKLPGRLIPTGFLPRYAKLPKNLRGPARFAERKLRGERWTYLAINLALQLELTRAQIPLQRLGKRIEHLVSMLALCHHAAEQDESQQRVARLQAELLRDKFHGVRVIGSLRSMQRIRDAVADVGRDIEKGQQTLIQNVKPQPFAHPWQ